MEALGGSMATKAEVDPMVQKDGLVAWAQLYCGADPRHPLAAPVYADLSGIAPLLIQVGSEETLFDDAIRLAAAAGHAQVPVRLEIAPEMIHVWHFFHPMLGAARDAIATAGGFIKAHLAS